MKYFAYGSNLSRLQMANRCPDSVPLITVKLKEYKLTFVGFSKKWNGGVATIIPKQNGITYGAIYEVTPQDIKKLDGFESVDTGIYYKVDLDIEGNQAFTYICNYKNLNNPSLEYLNTIRKGYEDWNLPLDLLSGLETYD